MIFLVFTFQLNINYFRSRWGVHSIFFSHLECLLVQVLAMPSMNSKMGWKLGVFKLVLMIAEGNILPKIWNPYSIQVYFIIILKTHHYNSFLVKIQYEYFWRLAMKCGHFTQFLAVGITMYFVLPHFLPALQVHIIRVFNFISICQIQYNSWFPWHFWQICMFDN